MILYEQLTNTLYIGLSALITAVEHFVLQAEVVLSKWKHFL